MANTVKALAHNKACKHMQNKLDDWCSSYHMNSCDNNLDVCCDLLKINAKVQGHLLTILNDTARDSVHDQGGESSSGYDPPRWGSSFTHSTPVKDTSVSLFRESQDRDLKLKELSVSRDLELHRLDSKKTSTHLEPYSADQSSSSFYPLKYSKHSFNESIDSSILPDSSRRELLVSRFIYIFSNDRLEVQNLLGRFIDDLEMIHRIIFIATVESFHAAKVAFMHFKRSVRKHLISFYSGPKTLEEAVNDFITRHLDCYDVQSCINDVIGVMKLNHKISFLSKIDFTLLSEFCREVCQVAFAMHTLEKPLDLALAVDGEHFDETKYLRTYDSDMRASTVYYHVWPALVQNNKVIVKGEAVTRRLNQASRSRSPYRRSSLSPSRQRHRACLTTSMLKS
ncbi:mitochondria-eating protein-like [Pelobates fuscus]|uniref:mitochondria-eating protein-like n=1 Tax=Pelobates fuscus TaxID=191477 RepID=UPI002FE4DD72